MIARPGNSCISVPTYLLHFTLVHLPGNRQNQNTLSGTHFTHSSQWLPSPTLLGLPRHSWLQPRSIALVDQHFYQRVLPNSGENRLFFCLQLLFLCCMVTFIMTLNMWCFRANKFDTINPAAVKLFSKEESRAFMSVFPDLVRDLTVEGLYKDMPAVNKHLAQVKPCPDFIDVLSLRKAVFFLLKCIQYNVPNGKKNRGMTVPISYKLIASKEDQTEDNLRLANILGWCVEFVSRTKICQRSASWLPSFLFSASSFFPGCRRHHGWLQASSRPTGLVYQRRCGVNGRQWLPLARILCLCNSVHSLQRQTLLFSLGQWIPRGEILNITDLTSDCCIPFHATLDHTSHVHGSVFGFTDCQQENCRWSSWHWCLWHEDPCRHCQVQNIVLHFLSPRCTGHEHGRFLIQWC